MNDNDPIDLTTNDFDTSGNINMSKFQRVPFNGKMVVGFFMNGCIHCTMMKPEFYKFSNICMNNGIGVVCKLESSNNPDFFKRMQSEKWNYNIDGFPTVIAYKNGYAHSIYQGKRDANSLLEYITSI